MTAEPLTPWQELLCASAGPAGSILLLVFLHDFPELSVCGIAHGIYNLLPVYPLDGGRCAYSICRLIFRKDSARHAFNLVQYLCLLLITIRCLCLFFSHKPGILPLLFCFGLYGRCFSEKFLAKHSCKRYNIATPKIKR
jgi:Zn-dependent protease